MIQPDSFGNLRFSHEEKLYTPEKSRVIWNGSASGVNLSKFDVTQKEAWAREIRERYGIPSDARVFVFIGRITRDKGINELFEASKTLLEKYNDAYLLMVGSVEKSESLQPHLYEWSQNHPRVLYAGYTNQVEKYMAASDVYILPSYREGFGSAVVEAEAMGLPVIVTDIPGPTDAMKKDVTGLVVRKGDAEDLYSAMETLYASKKMRDEMGHNALEFATTSFEQKELFEKICNDRRELIKKSTTR
jgi:glycosyltransferase involved in cell wall biosynthesis